MPKKTRRPLTAAEQEARRERGRRARAEVCALADAAMETAMNTPEGWQSFLWTAASHPERPGMVNLALIAYQAPGCRAESFDGWRDKGRQVRSNAQQAEQYGNDMGTVKIFTAVRKRKEDEKDGKEREEREELKGYRVGTLFSEMRTDPIEGAAPPQSASLTPEQIHAAAVTRLHEAGGEADEDADTRELLGELACTLYRMQGASADVAWTEGESAAHVAAVVLGVPAGGAALPTMEYGDENDLYRDFKDTAARVVAFGRQLADGVRGIA